MRFGTELAGVRLEHCIFNASGPRCATLEELDAIGRSDSAAIVTKSCTLEPREGNPEPRYSDLPHGGIQSMGLPNLGYRKYIEFLPALKQHGKPVIVSVAGLCEADNLKIIEALDRTGVDMIELNMSCPNIPGKPQTGYDFEQSDRLIGHAMQLTSKPLGLKLPPYFDFVHFERMAAVLNRHRPAYVCCINSLGNALAIDPETERTIIRPKDGFGGLSGSYVKPTALANVRKFYELLDGIDIVGVGGICTGEDVFEFILAGATAVQVGTKFMQDGHDIFETLEREFNELMERKGYTSIEEVRGKLKTR